LLAAGLWWSLAGYADGATLDLWQNTYWNENALQTARNKTLGIAGGVDQACDSLLPPCTMFESRQLRAQRYHNRAALLGDFMSRSFGVYRRCIWCHATTEASAML
jgi:hypothetical protein